MRRMVAGTRTILTMVASTKTADARPMPSILMVGLSPSTNARSTDIMIRAAEVMTRAVVAMPATINSVLEPR